MCMKGCLIKNKLDANYRQVNWYKRGVDDFDCILNKSKITVEIKWAGRALI